MRKLVKKENQRTTQHEGEQKASKMNNNFVLKLVKAIK